MFWLGIHGNFLWLALFFWPLFLWKDNSRSNWAAPTTWDLNTTVIFFKVYSGIIIISLASLFYAIATWRKPESETYLSIWLRPKFWPINTQRLLLLWQWTNSFRIHYFSMVIACDGKDETNQAYRMLMHSTDNIDKRTVKMRQI